MLAGRYGHAAERRAADRRPRRRRWRAPIVAGLPDLLAEAPFAARHEQARTRRRRAAAPHPPRAAGRRASCPPPAPAAPRRVARGDGRRCWAGTQRGSTPRSRASPRRRGPRASRWRSTPRRLSSRPTSEEPSDRVSSAASDGRSGRFCARMLGDGPAARAAEEAARAGGDERPLGDAPRRGGRGSPGPEPAAEPAPNAPAAHRPGRR